MFVREYQRLPRRFELKSKSFSHIHIDRWNLEGLTVVLPMNHDISAAIGFDWQSGLKDLAVVSNRRRRKQLVLVARPLLSRRGSRQGNLSAQIVFSEC
jgi:hypothetical protein